MEERQMGIVETTRPENPGRVAELDRFRLRRFVEGLAADECETRSEPVDLADIAEIFEGNRKAVLFRAAGPEHQELVGNVAGSRTRLARAFGVEPQALLAEIQRRLRTQPVIVNVARSEAPAQDVVLTSDEADLTALPVHLQHGADGAPYHADGGALDRTRRRRHDGGLQRHPRRVDRPYRDADRLVHLHVFNNGEFVFDLPLSDRQFEQLQGSPIVDGAMAMDTEGMSAAGGSLPEPVTAGYLSRTPSASLASLPSSDVHSRPQTSRTRPVPGASSSSASGTGRSTDGGRAWPRTLLADRGIVGVMPRRFAWWDCDVYLPLEHSSDPDRLASVFVRLKPGISDGLAEPALQSLIETLSKERPDRFPPQFRIHLVHMKEIAAGPWSGTLLMLFGAVAILLVIGSANVVDPAAGARQRDRA